MERSELPLFIERGVIIADGVIALALDELREKALLNIFVDIWDSERLQRARNFYVNQKHLSVDQAERILKTREREETLFVKNTREYADIIFAPESP